MPGHCALMGATRLASVIVQQLFSRGPFLFIFPTRDASPPLVVAFSVCVSPKSNKLQKVHDEKVVLGTFYHTTITYTPSILHLTQIRCNILTINTLLSVRYYQIHLHTTYTTCTLPHGTSTGGGYYGIGEQKSLLLRQILLRPCGVKPTAYDKISCVTAGWGV